MSTSVQQNVCNGVFYFLKVKQLFEQNQFYTTENSVGIMDGVDEGLFSWFTVNFLLGKIVYV